MPPHLAQPCYVALGWAHDSGLISRLELRALSNGFLFPKASCSRVCCSRIWLSSLQTSIYQNYKIRENYKKTLILVLEKFSSGWVDVKAVLRIVNGNKKLTNLEK